MEKKVLYISADVLNQSSRALIANQLPRSVEMTDAAKAYLVSGRLPGRTGRRYVFMGFKFGPSLP
ncbi:MAG: hypothetical protein HKL80_04510 [Acidimicrobiales bacterium]|nr:hypothetical protein [Acidimicrobiales bacterium]